MEKKKKNFLSNFLGLPEDAKVNFAFNPLDNSILKIAWNSPNDGKSNLFNMLMSTEPYTIRIKDNH
ncbi:hypothetical protein IKP85_06770 [bacterium]|nr:hypothetical protein [bacterium]